MQEQALQLLLMLMLKLAGTVVPLLELVKLGLVEPIQAMLRLAIPT